MGEEVSYAILKMVNCTTAASILCALVLVLIAVFSMFADYGAVSEVLTLATSEMGALVTRVEMVGRSKANAELLDDGASMNDLHLMLYRLENHLPFMFAHFNDGELSALMRSNGKEIADGKLSHRDSKGKCTRPSRWTNQMRSSEFRASANSGKHIDLPLMW